MITANCRLPSSNANSCYKLLILLAFADYAAEPFGPGVYVPTTPSANEERLTAHGMEREVCRTQPSGWS